MFKNGISKNCSFFDTDFDDKDLPRFVSKKWIEVDDQSEKNCYVHKEIKVKTPMLRSYVCDFSDPYIVVKGDIIVTNPDDAKRHKSVAFKNNAPFINCISEINGVQINNAEDLDVVMPMYNMFEYSKNYKKQQGVCGIITEINQVIPFLLLLNLLNARQVLQKILMMLVLVSLVGLQTKVNMEVKMLFC